MHIKIADIMRLGDVDATEFRLALRQQLVLPEADDSLMRSATRTHRVQYLLKQRAAAVNENVAVCIFISVKVMFQQRREEGAAMERLSACLEHTTAHIEAHDAAARRNASPLHCTGGWRKQQHKRQMR